MGDLTPIQLEYIVDFLGRRIRNLTLLGIHLFSVLCFGAGFEDFGETFPPIPEAPNCKKVLLHIGAPGLAYEQEDFWLFPLMPNLPGNNRWMLGDHQVRLDRRVKGNFVTQTTSVKQGNGTLPAKLNRDENGISLGYAMEAPNLPLPPKKKKTVMRTRFNDHGWFNEQVPVEVEYQPPPVPDWPAAMTQIVFMDHFDTYAPHSYGPNQLYRSSLHAGDTVDGKPNMLYNHGLRGEYAERANRESLSLLDDARDRVGKFALHEEARRKWKPEFYEMLAKLKDKFWDASQIEVFAKPAQGEPTDLNGTARLISSKPDPRLFAYREFLEDFLKTHKGYWTQEVVDPSLTTPLLVEEVLKIQLPRPVLHIPGGVTLPNGDKVTFLVGEAIEVGALGIKKEVNAEVFANITAEIFRQVWDSNSSTDYNRNGKILYAFGEAKGIRLHSLMGWEVFEPEKSHQLMGEPWWVIRHTPDSLAKWIDGLVKKPQIPPETIHGLRELFKSISH